MAEKFLTNYDQNEFVCTQGDAVDRFFILRKGKVGIYMNPECVNPPAYTILSHGKCITEIAETGSVMGEAGLFLGFRTASIVAHQPDTVIEHILVGPEGTARLIESQPAMGQTLCRSLALRLRAISGEMRHLFSAVSRISALQKRMASTYVRIVNNIKKMVSLNESTLILLNEFQNSDLYRQGITIQHEDNETQAFLKREIAQRRAGEIPLAAGTVLCQYGEVGRCMYLLLKGLLEVRIGGETIATIEPGEFVGEMAVLLKEAPYRSAEIRAVKNSRIAVITMDGFVKTAETHPQLLLRIGRQLAKRIYLSNRLSCTSDANALLDQRLLDNTIQAFDQLKEVCSGTEDLRGMVREIRDLTNQGREASLSRMNAHHMGNGGKKSPSSGKADQSPPPLEGLHW